MCGIFGYTGAKRAVEQVIEGLKNLEYRGYDSAGIAIHTENGIRTIKSIGRVKKLESKVKGVESNCSIGHTRWATHGLPTEINAHPHTIGKFSIVHNGIIENYQELKKKLIADGAKFISDTDSEVIVHLLNVYYNGDLRATMSKVVDKLKGAYAIAVICEDSSDTIIATCKDSPLIIGKSKNGAYVSSDMNALQGCADEVMVVSDGEMCIAEPSKIICYDSKGQSICKKSIDISQLVARSRKTNYSSHMLSEINEIPRAIQDTIDYYAKGLPKGLPEILKSVNKVIIVACGTAYNAGQAGKKMIEKLLGVSVVVEYASEFRYSEPVIDKDTLIIAISQSGETADTIAAVKHSATKGASILCITNVKDSSLTRVSDYVMYTLAGAEIAVAATKSYNTQLTALAILVAYWSNNDSLIDDLKKLPELTQKCIDISSSGELPYAMFVDSEKVFFIGRQLDYTVALEGSLKLKEISYIMSEGYAAGELKHGTLALIDKGTPVIVIITSKHIANKTMNAIHEVQARGAKVLLITSLEDIIQEAGCNSFVIPKTNTLLMPIISVIPLQFIAHEISRMRGLDPDRPRNLAKSVTVE